MRHSLYKQFAYRICLFAVCTIALVACEHQSASVPMAEKQFNVSVDGKWIIEQNQQNMLDPQTSGLVYRNGSLYSISDRSAHATQRKQLHRIDPNSAQIIEKLGPFVLSSALEKSCFAEYISNNPDYEALVNLPNQANAWLIATEDASYASMNAECANKFSATGSTSFPSLIVKLELIDQRPTITGVRALKFSAEDELGDFPNDGVEGLAITRDNRVLVGIERDQRLRARVFEFAYSENLFDQIDEFIEVQDAGLLFPKVSNDRHPINGMDIYYPNPQSAGYLVAAARNDDQLWLLDLAKKQDAKVVNVDFSAPSDTSGNCPSKHKIKITAIEGIAVHQDTIYMVNDPWKQVYPDNAVCDQDVAKYDNMSPLLFELTVDPLWFS